MPPKKKVNNKRNPSQKQIIVRPRISRNLQTGLDEAGRCWARLLADPCNAPLCHPVYSGTNGGILVRAQTTSTFVGGASDTAGYFVWVPGSQTTASGTFALDTTAAVLPGGGNYLVPGAAFLAASAGSFRCVAACVKVTWGGTELNRQGYLRFGNLTAGDVGVLGTSSVTTSAIGQLLEGGTRVPEEFLEVKWRPSDADQMPAITAASGSGANVDTGVNLARRGAIGIVFTSMPNSYPLIFETTAVYEYQPVAGVGLSSATMSTSKSNNTMDQVVSALDKTGNWMYTFGHVASRIAQLGYQAYNAYSNPIGMIAGTARKMIMG
jgi:hypothetical protein